MDMRSLYVAGGHGEHTLDFPDEYLPAGHCMQAKLVSDLSRYNPSKQVHPMGPVPPGADDHVGQCWQPSDTESLQVFTGHSSHAVAPLVSVRVPGGHAWQSLSA